MLTQAGAAKAPNTKSVFCQTKGFCVISGFVLEGPNWALALGMGKIRLPDAGASISLALDQRQRWEWSKIRLLTLAYLLRWR